MRVVLAVIVVLSGCIGEPYEDQPDQEPTEVPQEQPLLNESASSGNAKLIDPYSQGYRFETTADADGHVTFFGFDTPTDAAAFWSICSPAMDLEVKPNVGEISAWAALFFDGNTGELAYVFGSAAGHELTASWRDLAPSFATQRAIVVPDYGDPLPLEDRTVVVLAATAPEETTFALDFRFASDDDDFFDCQNRVRSVANDAYVSVNATGESSSYYWGRVYEEYGEASGRAFHSDSVERVDTPLLGTPYLTRHYDGSYNRTGWGFGVAEMDSSATLRMMYELDAYGDYAHFDAPDTYGTSPPRANVAGAGLDGGFFNAALELSPATSRTTLELEMMFIEGDVEHLLGVAPKVCSCSPLELFQNPLA